MSTLRQRLKMGRTGHLGEPVPRAVSARVLKNMRKMLQDNLATQIIFFLNIFLNISQIPPHPSF